MQVAPKKAANSTYASEAGIPLMEIIRSQAQSIINPPTFFEAADFKPTDVVMLTVRGNNETICFPFQLSKLGPLFEKLLSMPIFNGANRSELAEFLRLALNADTEARLLKSRNCGVEAYNLTARELEVLHYLSLGLSQKEIGVKLFIAPCTVNRHIQNIYGKLDTNNASGAVAKAIREGLMD